MVLAKGPPPGTMITGPLAFSIASIQRRKSGDAAELPPSLTTRMGSMIASPPRAASFSPAGAVGTTLRGDDGPAALPAAIPGSYGRAGARDKVSIATAWRSAMQVCTVAAVPSGRSGPPDLDA